MFCGVNTHFQNGIAEKAIQDLQEQAWKQLLHAKARWPEVVHLLLWPYALRNIAYKHGASPPELFSRSQVALNLQLLHTFGCTVYTLNNRLQSGKSIPKWDPCDILGLNLGPSPRHR